MIERHAGIRLKEQKKSGQAIAKFDTETARKLRANEWEDWRILKQAREEQYAVYSKRKDAISTLRFQAESYRVTDELERLAVSSTVSAETKKVLRILLSQRCDSEEDSAPAAIREADEEYADTEQIIKDMMAVQHSARLKIKERLEEDRDRLLERITIAHKALELSRVKEIYTHDFRVRNCQLDIEMYGTGKRSRPTKKFADTDSESDSDSESDTDSESDSEPTQKRSKC